MSQVPEIKLVMMTTKTFSLKEHDTYVSV